MQLQQPLFYPRCLPRSLQRTTTIAQRLVDSDRKLTTLLCAAILLTKKSSPRCASYLGLFLQIVWRQY